MTLRAVIWRAVSSQVQATEDKLSLQEQEHWGREWCKTHNATIVAVLTVDGHPRSEPDIFKLFQDYEAIGCPAYREHYDLCRKNGFDVLLAWSDDRLGRAPSIITHIIDMTVSVAGAVVELKHGGTINRQNKNIRMGMSVASVPTQLDQFRERRHFGMNKRASKGLPTSSGVHMSHKLLRNENGKAERLVVDESKRRLFNDLAELILEGVGWRSMGTRLYERGHVSTANKAYSESAMYSMVLHPVFWGHSARFFSEKKFPNGYKKDLWVFDDAEPLPEGVQIWRNTHDPVWTGDLAEKVQDELRRRRSSINGHANPLRTHLFSGLLVCGECRYRLVFHGTNSGFRGYYCKSHERHQTAPFSVEDCSQRRNINEKRLIQFFSEKLQEALDKRTPLVFVDETPTRATFNHVEQIEVEIAALTDKISRAVRKQLDAPETVQDIYQEEIGLMSAQRERLEAALTVAKRERTTHSLEGRMRALEELEQMGGVQALWVQPGAFVNQFLHRFMGRRRLVVINDTFPGTVDLSALRQ